ncbi:GSCOCG00011584001-RA-CDS [Cotesia congregata]|nr:GSCOCG00011584001-RA-CDS [Cotesia congregata]
MKLIISIGYRVPVVALRHSPNLLPHDFIAKSQSAFLKQVKESLQDGEFLAVCDFAENYAFIVQDAVPGFHWNNNQATIFSVFIYFKQNGELKHRSLIIISDSMNHDVIAVHVYSKIVTDFIKELNPQATKVIYFSDGAPEQFKNSKNFVNIYYHDEDFGLKAGWHYFATAHGKGPCDGAGGTFERKAVKVSLQQPVDKQITTTMEI